MLRVGKYGAMAIVLLFAQCSHASFSTIFQSATVDDQARAVTFEIGFNQKPDFATQNENGDDASAVQVYIDPKHSGMGFDYFDSVSLVRGVHLGASDQVPVIDLKDGAFGDERGVTHFTLDDMDTMRFSVPFDVLGTSDGRFDYRVESYEYGTLTSMIDSTTAVVPLPNGAYGAIPTFALMGAILWMRRRKVSAT
jgi:hypothetical protein